MASYAGIGSRRTPEPILELMTACARELDRRGWRLRSGGADGADTAFWEGASEANTEIYLPWAKFNTHVTPYLTDPKADAFTIAARHHPAWQYLKPAVKKLMARNVHQVLGRDLDDPVLMIVCWTPDGSLDGEGSDSGGTGMALRVAAAEAPDALVFNLAIREHRVRIDNFINEGVAP